MEACWANNVYGGSVFTPVGNYNKQGEERHRHNNLRNEMCAMHIDYLYGGGYYVIQNVKYRSTSGGQEDSHHNVDIYILIDRVDHISEFLDRKICRVEHKDAPLVPDPGRRVSTKAGKITETKDTYAAQATSPVRVRKYQGHKDFYFDEIRQYLNGFGRMVHFTCHKDLGNPTDLELTMMEEGYFNQGEIDGYGRRITVSDNGFVEVGFFRHGKPLGKYHSFDWDGKTIEEGIRDGDDKLKDEGIKDFMTRNTMTDLG